MKKVVRFVEWFIYMKRWLIVLIRCLFFFGFPVGRKDVFG